MSYLGAESLIVDFLKLNMQSLSARHIITANNLQGVIEKTQLTPSVQLIFFDDQPEAMEKGELNSQFTQQFWQIVIVVRNVSDTSGKQARDDAGSIVNEVLALLNGKHFKHPYGRMIRVKSPYRPTYRNGFFYFPLMFKLRMKTTGSEAYTKPL